MLCETRQITPEKGELTGTCCICGEQTTKGYHKKFKANMTCADYVSNGDIICPTCYYLMQNSDEYRRTMYLLTNNEYKPFKKAEAKNIIFNLKDEPFYLYLTKTWQKIGWIRMNQAYNTGLKNDIKIVIDYQIITCNLTDLKTLCQQIQKLREIKLSKKTLESGFFEIYEYKKLIKEFGKKEAENIIKNINALKWNPTYELALYIEK
jgi:hypothetical protein